MEWNINEKLISFSPNYFTKLGYLSPSKWIHISLWKSHIHEDDQDVIQSILRESMESNSKEFSHSLRIKNT